LNYNTTVSFVDNEFQDLKVVGRDSQEASLIFINGAQVRASGNKFNLLGEIDDSVWLCGSSASYCDTDDNVNLFLPTLWKEHTSEQ